MQKGQKCAILLGGESFKQRCEKDIRKEHGGTKQNEVERGCNGLAGVGHTKRVEIKNIVMGLCRPTNPNCCR